MKSDFTRWVAMQRALRDDRAFPRISQKSPHGLSAPLIVSLTSYPPRFSTLHLSLRSLLDQSVAPDGTILWVAAQDLSKLPSAVTELQSQGLTIRCCDDLRSYKKLVPSLIAFPDAFVVTADDDLYYGTHWLRDLVEAAAEQSGCIITHRAHLAVQDSAGAFLPYSKWRLETKETADQPPRALLFPTSGAGTLYPPKSLHQLVTDQVLFARLCPSADDVWFFWMGRLARTPHRRTRFAQQLLWWNGSQDVGLFHENLWAEGNDAQIRAMEAHFGKLAVEIPDPAWVPINPGTP
jgi:hypothetical protein